MAYFMTQWYVFTPLKKAELLSMQKELKTIAQANNIIGLILLAEEGCNGTIAGSKEAVQIMEEYIRKNLGAANFQYWESEKKPFRRFKADIRNEIVALKKKGTRPFDSLRSLRVKHLAPQEFHNMIQDKDVTLLDTRNWYETNIGTFKNARIPNTTSFQEFPEFVEKSDIPKDKKTVLFCTSGIRCEKAAEEMRSQGYKEVYQLDGGITNYLKEYPEGAWEGECFMFDHRVAVDSHLEPSKRYFLCRMCGNPGDVKTSCTACQTEHHACADCLQSKKPYCSRLCKNILQKKTAA